MRINTKIITVTSSDARNLGIAWQNAFTFTAQETPSSGTDTSSSSTPTVPGIRLGKFTHTPMQVQATLNALETKGRSKVLSNPTLQLLDGEHSYILSGSKYFYPVYKGKDQAGISIYDTAEISVGIYLQVGVQIGKDDDMVLTIYPAVSSLSGFTAINGANYPSIVTSEEQTTVKAYTGDVIVLGGIVADTKNLIDTDIPFLSRIPWLGKLFSSKNNTDGKSELMIILTPELVEEGGPRTPVQVTVTTPGR